MLPEVSILRLTFRHACQKVPPAGGMGVRGVPLQARGCTSVLCLRQTETNRIWGSSNAKRDFSRAGIWPTGGSGAWVRPDGSPMTLALVGVTLCTHGKWDGANTLHHPTQPLSGVCFLWQAPHPAVVGKSDDGFSVGGFPNANK